VHGDRELNHRWLALRGARSLNGSSLLLLKLMAALAHHHKNIGGAARGTGVRVAFAERYQRPVLCAAPGSVLRLSHIAV